MTKEQLIALGLDDEMATKVQSLFKTELDGNYVPKATFDAERQKVKDLNQQVTDRDAQIVTLGKFKGDNEALQQKVSDLTKANEDATIAFKNKMEALETSTALRIALNDKVYNVDDILPKLDVSKITIKDGAVFAGLTEQIDAIKEASPYYFKDVSNSVKGWQVKGTDAGEGGSNNTSSNVDWASKLAEARAVSTSEAKNAQDAYWG